MLALVLDNVWLAIITVAVAVPYVKAYMKLTTASKVVSTVATDVKTAATVVKKDLTKLADSIKYPGKK